MPNKKIKEIKGLKLGYYAQILFVKNGKNIGIPNDLYLALLEFTKHCEEVVLFLNHSTNSNRDTFALPPKCRLVDLGPNQPMWKRLFGYGFDKKKFINEAEQLDAIIIQGPTPLLYHLAKPLKKPKVFFLIVGMIVGAFPGQFRPYGLLKHWGINLMVKVIETNQRKAFKKGVVLANNHLNVKTYSTFAPSFLVSKALVTKSEIVLKNNLEITTPIKLLYYGRIEPDKHIETILRACHLLKQENISFKLTLAGDCMGLYKEFLLKEIQYLQLEGFVTFTGRVKFTEKKQYFHNNDIFIFSTCGTEGFPRVIWEAFSFGIPVIAAQYPGSTGFFQHHKELAFFPRKDFKELANQIKIVSSDPKLREKLSQNGLKLLMEHTRDKGHKNMIDIIKKEVNALA